MPGGTGQQPLRPETLSLLESKTVQERKALGQYFTPAGVREKLLSLVPVPAGAEVLEPSIGTGEFAADILAADPTVHVTGYDVDPAVLAVAATVVPEATLVEGDFLTSSGEGRYDCVIGNPPYFEMPNLCGERRHIYRDVISGRPNIFALFFAAALKALKPGGYLGFVVPPSMNNGAQFAALRQHILAHADVTHIAVINDPRLFEDAQTAVQLIVLRKRGDEEPRQYGRHVVDLASVANAPSQRIVFCEDAATVEAEFLNRSSLWALGYEAVTGATVWNQVKDDLRDSEVDGAVPLIWAHNITERRGIALPSNHKTKPQYVVTSRVSAGPAIAVSRVVGSVGSGSIRCALIPDGLIYTAENHVNIIRPRKGVTPAIDLDALLDLLRKPEVNARIRRLTGNTQLSATELTHFLPLDSSEKAVEHQVSLF